MFAIAARRMGYRVHTLSPERDTPTGQIADVETAAPYDDLDAVRGFARGVRVVTFEFENVPAAAVSAAAEHAPVFPSASALATTQHRAREKTFLQKVGLPTTPFVPVHAIEDLRTGLARLGCPAILKTAGSGYDGKGQHQIDGADEAETAWAALDSGDAILEAFVDFEREVSVVAARAGDGAVVHYGVIENVHRRRILDLSTAPAPVPPPVAEEAVGIARAALEHLGVVGVLCVELFLTRDGRLLVNELAPRPHNSGHLTIEACVTNQFEQQVRAVCGLPLGSTEQLRPAAMANLLGDLWAGGEPDWRGACAFPDAKLHLYGKREARPGRKMGHLTALGPSVDQASRTVLAARTALVRPG
jgi:5-(carboxyamino)imidazole ribonucleotide synthase